MFFKKKINLDYNNIPKHIAFIMDGNGRWATKRGLPRTAGHKAGLEALFSIADAAKELKIEAITVYAFSTENWKRSKEEIDYIFKLLETAFDEKYESIKRDDVRIRMIGTLDRLVGQYDSLKEKMEKVIEDTKNNKGVTLNIAFNYGGHDEIIRAVKKVASDVKENNVKVEDINENLFETYLMTHGLPKIDLMIRTSGEKRLSNFLLWQLAYSEMIFTSTYWPDFNGDELKKCIADYQKRDRRFGGVK
jgi:undecaprenyl diphosphate synthase